MIKKIALKLLKKLGSFDPEESLFVLYAIGKWSLAVYCIYFVLSVYLYDFVALYLSIAFVFVGLGNTFEELKRVYNRYTIFIGK